MGFWAKLAMGLALMAKVVAVLMTLEIPGGSTTTPEVRLEHEGRVFWLSVNIRRAS